MKEKLITNISTLQDTINETLITFDDIKTTIVNKGVEVPDGTPASKYSEKIEEVYDTGINSVAPDIEEQTTRLNDGLTGGGTDAQTMKEKIYNDGYEAGIGDGVDTSADTVTPEVLVKDYTAHDAEGKPIVGELDLEEVKGEGYTEGHAAGYTEGHEAGEAVGAETGRKAWMDAYLEGALSNNDAKRLFCTKGWTVATFRPTKNLRAFYSASQMFYDCAIQGDVAQILEECGVTFDFSQCSSNEQAFAYTGITRLGVINFTRPYAGIHRDTFKESKSLHTIDKFCVNEMWSYSNTFYYCFALENLTMEGIIGQNGFNVSWSPLSKASLTSIVNALSATTTGLTVTLRLDAVNKAFETSEGAMDGSTSDEWLALAATKSNWTISLINS